VFHEVLFSAGALAEGQGENRATVCSVAQGGRASVQLAAGMDPVRELAGTYVRERENTIWPVSRPLEAAAVASRVRGGMGPAGGGSSGSCHMAGKKTVGASAPPTSWWRRADNFADSGGSGGVGFSTRPPGAKISVKLPALLALAGPAAKALSCNLTATAAGVRLDLAVVTLVLHFAVGDLPLTRARALERNGLEARMVKGGSFLDPGVSGRAAHVAGAVGCAHLLQVVPPLRLSFGQHLRQGRASGQGRSQQEQGQGSAAHGAYSRACQSWGR